MTVATNMAGRGTDILLGGSSKGIAKVLAKHMMLVKLGLAEGPSPETILAYDQVNNIIRQWVNQLSVDHGCRNSFILP